MLRIHSIGRASVSLQVRQQRPFINFSENSIVGHRNFSKIPHTGFQKKFMGFKPNLTKKIEVEEIDPDALAEFDAEHNLTGDKKKAKLFHSSRTNDNDRFIFKKDINGIRKKIPKQHYPDHPIHEVVSGKSSTRQQRQDKKIVRGKGQSDNIDEDYNNGDDDDGEIEKFSDFQDDGSRRRQPQIDKRNMKKQKNFEEIDDEVEEDFRASKTHFKRKRRQSSETIAAESNSNQNPKYQAKSSAKGRHSRGNVVMLTSPPKSKSSASLDTSKTSASSTFNKQTSKTIPASTRSKSDTTELASTVSERNNNFGGFRPLSARQKDHAAERKEKWKKQQKTSQQPFDKGSGDDKKEKNSEPTRESLLLDPEEIEQMGDDYTEIKYTKSKSTNGSKKSIFAGPGEVRSKKTPKGSSVLTGKNTKKFLKKPSQFPYYKTFYTPKELVEGETLAIIDDPIKDNTVSSIELEDYVESPPPPAIIPMKHTEKAEKRKDFQLEHIAEILTDYHGRDKPPNMDTFIHRYIKRHREIDAPKNRLQIIDGVFGVLRWKILINYLIRDSQLNGRALWLERARIYQNLHFPTILLQQSIPAQIRLSCPSFLYDTLVADYGEKETFQICKVIQGQAPVYARVNPLKTTRDELVKKLLLKKVKVEPSVQTEFGIAFAKRLNITAISEWRDGYFELQDESSQIVASLVEAKPGQLVCDYCAGSGGKTLAFAHLLEGKGQIYVCDNRNFVLTEAKRRFKKAGISNVNPLLIGHPHLNKLKHKMDWVLADVPCSGTGTLRRNPDAKYKIDKEFVERMLVLQREIFEAAVELMKLSADARILYSTCSILKCENEKQIEYFEKEYDLVVDKVVQSLPKANSNDGFFAAVLKWKHPETSTD